MRKSTIIVSKVLGPFVALVAGAAPAAGQPTFEGLGYLRSSPSPFSVGLGISADGQAVVGWASSPHGTGSLGCCEAFVWTSAAGMQPLSDFPGPAFESQADAVSGDGSVVVGYGQTSVSVGAIWEDGNPPVQVPELPGGPIGGGHALGISDDGRVIVGYDWAANGQEGFIYRPRFGSMIPMGDLPGGPFESRALAVSGDGAVVVGSGRTESGTEATRWTAGGGLVSLGDLPGGAVNSVATAASESGDVIVGYGTSAEGEQAFRWTDAGGMQPLGDLPGGDFFSRALDVSADGSVVVGYSRSDVGSEAFIWTEASGEMRSLRDVLMEAGIDLRNWRLLRASGVSADGTAYTGYGYSSGPEEAWIARLPFCPPDLNGDGAVDFFDFLEFQNLFAAGDPRADFTGDGTLDFFDFLAFQQTVAEGCH